MFRKHYQKHCIYVKLLCHCHPLTTQCQNNDINVAFGGKIEQYKSDVSLGELCLAIWWKPAYWKLLSVYSLVNFWCHADTGPSEPSESGCFPRQDSMPAEKDSHNTHPDAVDTDDTRLYFPMLHSVSGLPFLAFLMQFKINVLCGWWFILLQHL